MSRRMCDTVILRNALMHPALSLSRPLIGGENQEIREFLPGTYPDTFPLKSGYESCLTEKHLEKYLIDGQKRTK
jgi:hypothetical protein